MKRASLVSNLDTCRALTEYRNASRASQTLNRRVTRGINLIMIARSDERGADNLPKAATRTSRDAAVSECSTRSTRRQYARAQRVRCARTEGEGPLGSNPQASAGASEANEPSSPSLSRPDAPAAVAVASAESGPDQAGVIMDYDLPPRLVLAAQERIRAAVRATMPPHTTSTPSTCSRSESHPPALSPTRAGEPISDCWCHRDASSAPRRTSSPRGQRALRPPTSRPGRAAGLVRLDDHPG